MLPLQVEHPSFSDGRHPGPVYPPGHVGPSSKPQGHTHMDTLPRPQVTSRADQIPKSQSYPVPAKTSQRDVNDPDYMDKNTHVVRTGFVVGDGYTSSGGLHPGRSSSPSIQPAGQTRDPGQKQEEGRLSPTKLPPGSACMYSQ